MQILKNWGLGFGIRLQGVYQARACSSLPAISSTSASCKPPKHSGMFGCCGCNSAGWGGPQPRAGPGASQDMMGFWSLSMHLEASRSISRFLMKSLNRRLLRSPPFAGPYSSPSTPSPPRSVLSHSRNISKHLECPAFPSITSPAQTAPPPHTS